MPFLTERLPAAMREWYWSASAATWVLRIFVLAWALLVFVPLVILLVYSFFETKSFVTIHEFTFNTWISLFDSGRWEVALRTLRIALTITMVELLIAFPFALWLAKGCHSKVTKAVVLALLTIPFFLDISSRTIVWRAILGQNGLVNVALLQSGIVSEPLEWLLYSEFSVHFGMIAPHFPTMVLPIYFAISIIDDDLLKASNDLGASPLQTLMRVIIPLSLPGILAGITFTLGPALTVWVEPGMLGGGFVNLISHSIESAYTALRYPIVAALSTFIILLLAILLALLVVVMQRTVSVAGIFRAMHQ